MHKTFIVV